MQLFSRKIINIFWLLPNIILISAQLSNDEIFQAVEQKMPKLPHRQYDNTDQIHRTRSVSGIRHRNRQILSNDPKSLELGSDKNPYRSDNSLINQRLPLVGSLDSFSNNYYRRYSNNSVVLMGRSSVLCREPDKRWDSLKITVFDSSSNRPKCRRNVCGYLSRSTMSRVQVKYLASSFKTRGVWNEKLGQFSLDKLIVDDEAKYTCTFTYIAEPNKVTVLNLSVIAGPRASIREASVLVDRQPYLHQDSI